MPMSWNDLSKKDYLYVCKLFGNLISNSANPDEKNHVNDYYAAKVLLINRFCKFRFRTALIVTASQYADLLPITNFLDKKVNIDQQHLPKIRIGLRTFYGPQAGLTTSTFAEFIAADTYFVQMATKTDPLLKYKLIASLYRRKRSGVKKEKRNGTWNGDYRQSFNDNSIEQMALFFQKRINPVYAQAIVYFYWGFREKHVLRFENVFEPPKNTKLRVANNYGWVGTLLQLSGDKFGDIEKTGDTNWFTVLLELSRQLDINSQKQD